MRVLKFSTENRDPDRAAKCARGVLSDAQTGRVRLAWLTACLTITAALSAAASAPSFNSCLPATATPATQLEHVLRHDPASELGKIHQETAILLERAKPLGDERKARRRANEPLIGTFTLQELRDHYHDDSSILSSREIRALEEIHRIAQRLEQDNDNAPTQLHMLREILEGLRHNRRSPIPDRVGILAPWKLFMQNHDRTIAHGSTPAINVTCPATKSGGIDHDHSRCDPVPSPFWTQPEDIASHDFAAGFGRVEVPDYAGPIWDYAGPKTSAGTHAGFEIRNGKERLKVKLGEVNSEPFTARLFHALGYHVDPTDYASEIKVRYTRRLFREFNLRRPLLMRLRPLGIPAGTVDLQPQYDPFEFVTWAVLKNGSRLTGADLKHRLLINPDAPAAAADSANFREEFESELSHLVFGPVNIQPEDGVGESLGSWDFGGLGHEHLRELRGVGLLAAWVGWFDARFDNTRLRVVRSNGESRLLFFFSDVGAGMGSGRGWMVRHGERADLMEAAFTSPRIVRGAGRMTTPFRIRNYETIVPNPAFREMTMDDARWMGRMIGEVSEQQLRSALVASGYAPGDVDTYVAILLRRRNQMLEDLELQPHKTMGSHLNF